MRLRALLELIRLPNVFTVVADIMMGYLLVHPNLQPTPRFACLLAASICLYWAGMVLNDVFDVAQDTAERPERPIPSGRISLGTARVFGWALLFAGVGLGHLAGRLEPIAELPWRSGAIALFIAACVVLYDGVFKRSQLGPLFMGACRTGNILLGMSAGPVIHEFATPVLQFDAAQLAIAGGLGLFVAGVTWFARDEAQTDGGTRNNLQLGTMVMLLGLVWLALFTLTRVCQAGQYQLQMNPYIWPLLVLSLGLSIIRRVGAVLMNPTSSGVQIAVRQCILSLIVFDAAICLATRSPWFWSVIIVALIVPMLALGRWFYST